MTLKGMVKQYASLSTELAEKKKKAGIDELEHELEQLAGKIKDVARASEPEVVEASSADGFRISIARSFRKWFDMQAIKKFASKAELQIITNEALEVEVNKEKFEELVKGGLVSRELRQKSFREEEMTPRVSLIKK